MSSASNFLNVNALFNKEISYEIVKEISDWLLERVPLRPKIAIICGSGLSGIAERLTDVKIFPYNIIPHFPISTVAGHKSNLIFGKISNVDVVCMAGRFHSYEGYANSMCTLPIKVFKLLGIELIILTCASGGINRMLQVGDIMLIKDHIGLPLWSLQHPLIGANDERFGPRFPPANRLYSKELRDLFRKTAESLNVFVKEGVYVSYGGPSYETVSELKAFSILGGDCVGMSVAQEAIVAGYCGIKLLALTIITNMTVMDFDSQITPNHKEVMEIGNKKTKEIEEMIIKFVENLND